MVFLALKALAETGQTNAADIKHIRTTETLGAPGFIELS
jgi:hypothetical protein